MEATCDVLVGAAVFFLKPNNGGKAEITAFLPIISSLCKHLKHFCGQERIAFTGKLVRVG